jgi:Ca2+-binding RTX toxin-like protein
MSTEFHKLSASADILTMSKGWHFVDSSDAAWKPDLASSSAIDLVVDGRTGTDTLVIKASYTSGWFFDFVPMLTTGFKAIMSDGSQVQFLNFEKLMFHGTGSDVTITLGNALANTIVGGALEDTFLFGFAGNDTIDGKAGNDVINGGSGNDVIIGNTGKDFLTGGTGNDKFKLWSAAESKTTADTRDVITDFSHGHDKIDVSAINGLSAASGFKTFKFVGTAAFDGKHGEIRVSHINHSGTASDITIVEGDITLDRHADFSINLKGLINLTSIDFVL